MSRFVFNAHTKISGIIHGTVKLQIKAKCSFLQQCNGAVDGPVEFPVLRSSTELFLVVADYFQHESITTNKHMLVKWIAQLQVGKTVCNDDGVCLMWHVT